MGNLKITGSWLEEILPDGWPIGTSGLITGPGGSGKPLIGNTVAASWLREGGSVVFMSLQYPDPTFISEGLRQVAGLDLEDFRGHYAFIELDAEMQGWESVAEDHLRANLVRWEVWEDTLKVALEKVPGEGPGTLVFGSALNLLLFSPTYGPHILEQMKRTMRGDGETTFLFSVSNSAKKEMIEELEELADNLLVSHSTRDPFRLFLHVERMKGVSFDETEIEVPFTSQTLEEVKAVAEHSRRRVIPLISSI